MSLLILLKYIALFILIFLVTNAFFSFKRIQQEESKMNPQTMVGMVVPPQTKSGTKSLRWAIAIIIIVIALLLFEDFNIIQIFMPLN